MSVSVAVGAYYVACLVVCLLPKRWTWGRPVLKEEESVACSAELGQVHHNDAAQEIQETRAGPGNFSRSTTFRQEGVPVYRLDSSTGRN